MDSGRNSHEVRGYLSWLWDALLPDVEISPTADFFIAGGNSIIAITMMDHITRILGVSMSAGEFYSHSTFSDFTSLILEQIQPADTFPRPPQSPAAAAGTITLGGDLPVHRIGYGAMQLTGPGVWGMPADQAAAANILRQAVGLGVNFIDTADSYGPAVNEELISQVLYPYPDDLVIATKGGFIRPGPDKWEPLCRPAYLRQQVEMSLRRLRLERIDLYQLHRVDPLVELADQIGELRSLQEEGKIRHIGLCEVNVSTIKKARKIADIVSVQNCYNFADRYYDSVVDYCESEGIAFVAWFPLGNGDLVAPGSALEPMARRSKVSLAQLALTWLLRRSEVIMPIPGTDNLEHLKENVFSAVLDLSDETYAELRMGSA